MSLLIISRIAFITEVKTDLRTIIELKSQLSFCHQVSRLVILHEEAEDGNAMPNLEQPVKVVSNAVHNLVKVKSELKLF